MIKELGRFIMIFIYISAFAFILIGMIGGIILSSHMSKIGEKAVPCYDEANNQIKGLTCIEDIYSKGISDYTNLLLIGVFLLVVAFGYSILGGLNE